MTQTARKDTVLNDSIGNNIASYDKLLCNPISENSNMLFCKALAIHLNYFHLFSYRLIDSELPRRHIEVHWLAMGVMSTGDHP